MVDPIAIVPKSEHRRFVKWIPRLKRRKDDTSNVDSGALVSKMGSCCDSPTESLVTLEMGWDRTKSLS